MACDILVKICTDVHLHITSIQPVTDHSALSPTRPNSVYADIGAVQIIYLLMVQGGMLDSVD